MGIKLLLLDVFFGGVPNKSYSCVHHMTLSCRSFDASNPNGTIFKINQLATLVYDFTNFT